MTVTREKLHEEVWAKPMTTVAKRYQVSSNYLARICERLSVPRPPRGYWQQRAAGVDVEREPLPDSQPGDDLEWARDGSEPKRQPMSTKMPRRWKNDADRPEQHPLLVGARAHFDHARPQRDSEYVLPYKKNIVDVFVSKSMLARALTTASELFLALEDKGQRVVLAPSNQYGRADCELREGAKRENDYSFRPGQWRPATPTVVLVGEIAIGLTLFETSEEVEVRYQDGKYVRIVPPKAPTKPARRAVVPDPNTWTTKRWLPSGRLALHAYAAERVEWEQYWIEPNAGEITTLGDEIAKTFERAVPKIAKLIEEGERLAEQRRKEFEVQQQRWQREAEERRRKDEEAAREKRILEDIASWRLARDIRMFVADAKRMVEEANCRLTKDGTLEKSLEWALAHAEKVDPLSALRADLRKVVSERAKASAPPVGAEPAESASGDKISGAGG